jgi:hypothetical protein
MVCLIQAALVTFSQGGNVRITKWYDQSGSGNDAYYPTDTSYMPMIVVNGVLRTTNLKATIDFLTTKRAAKFSISIRIFKWRNQSILFSSAKITDYPSSNAGVLVRLLLIVLG